MGDLFSFDEHSNIFDPADFAGGAASSRAGAMQAEQNALERDLRAQFAAEARADVTDLFPRAQEARQQATDRALGIMSATIPQQLGAFQQGNVAAQQQLSQGLPQFQRAILGQPVDFSQFRPQALGGGSLNVNQSFGQSGAPLAQFLRDAIAPQAAPPSPQVISGQDNSGVFSSAGMASPAQVQAIAEAEQDVRRGLTVAEAHELLGGPPQFLA